MESDEKNAKLPRKTLIIPLVMWLFFVGVAILFWKAGLLKGYAENSWMNFLWLGIGNVFYYAAGIALAFALKDNRAFCKYLCPIPAFQKVGGRFSLIKLKIDAAKCTKCRKCEHNCPMNIKLLVYSARNQRILSTECILCTTCANVCPEDALKLGFGLDAGTKEEISYR